MILVEDVNDNDPVIANRRFDYFIPTSVKKGIDFLLFLICSSFSSFSPFSLFFFLVIIRSALGDLIFHVNAYDWDENDQLRYKLFGIDAEFFQINRHGLVFAKQGEDDMNQIEILTII